MPKGRSGSSGGKGASSPEDDIILNALSSEQEDMLLREPPTIEERRQLRTDYNTLNHKMTENKQVLEDYNAGAIEEYLGNVNTLFKKVGKTREARVDAESMTRITGAVVKQAERLQANMKRYDQRKFLSCLMNKFTEEDSDFFDWTRFGVAVGPCFRTVPNISFMCGPLEKPEVERKKRKQRERHVDDEDVEETQPQDVVEKSKEEEEPTAKRIAVLRNTIVKTVRENKATLRRGTSSYSKEPEATEASLFDVVFNPKSFTQTVENLFDLSFLVHKQGIGLEVDERELPVVRRHTDDSVADSTGAAVVKSKQAVLNISFKDYNKLVDKLALVAPLVPTRPGYKPDEIVRQMIEQRDK